MGKHSKGKHIASKEKQSGLFGKNKESNIEEANSIDDVDAEGASTSSSDTMPEDQSSSTTHSSSNASFESVTGEIDLTLDTDEFNRVYGEGGVDDIIVGSSDVTVEFEPIIDSSHDGDESPQDDSDDSKSAKDSNDSEDEDALAKDADSEDDEAPNEQTDVEDESTNLEDESGEVAKDEGESNSEETDKAKDDASDTSESSEKQVHTHVFDMPKHKRRFNPKRFAIASAIVVGLLGAIYLGGAAFFHGHMFPNTTVARQDISFDDAQTASQALEEQVGSYTFTVKGQGVNLVMTSDEADLTLESDYVADTVLQSQNIWAWPYEIFQNHDESEVVAQAMSANGLAEVLAPVVATANLTAVAPENAKVVFNPNRAIFEIIPEKIGSTLDLDKAVEQVALGVLNLEKNIFLTNDSLVLPTVYRDDQKLQTALKSASDYLTTDVKLMIGGNLAAEVNANTVGPWITITPESEVVFNNDALSEWAQSVADSCNTVGTERTYIRPDGKEVTVKGGSYGWKVNNNDLAAQITEAVNNRSVATIDVPVIQSGNGFAAIGSQDWGARYVDVDISEQHARFYDDSGALVWETPIITGGNGHYTPTGVYSVNRKQSPTVLVGQMTEEGVPEYESYVTYWMPFIGNSVGLHDATWQSSFGGNRYRQGFGSHGCVNLPFSAAQELYSMLEVGDVVVVHY